MSKQPLSTINWTSTPTALPRRDINNYLLLWTGTTGVVSFVYGYSTGFQTAVQTLNLSDPEKERCGPRSMVLSINRLKTKTLKTPLDILIENDADGFIAKTPDLPLYGYGDDRDEAVTNLKIEIESLYEDLLADDNFSEEWLEIKKFLKDRIIN